MVNGDCSGGGGCGRDDCSCSGVGACSVGDNGCGCSGGDDTCSVGDDSGDCCVGEGGAFLIGKGGGGVFCGGCSGFVSGLMTVVGLSGVGGGDVWVTEVVGMVMVVVVVACFVQSCKNVCCSSDRSRLNT